MPNIVRYLQVTEKHLLPQIPLQLPGKPLPVVEFAHFVFVAFAVLGELVGQRLDVWRDLRFGISPRLVRAPSIRTDLRETL